MPLRNRCIGDEYGLASDEALENRKGNLPLAPALACPAPGWWRLSRITFNAHGVTILLEQGLDVIGCIVRTIIISGDTETSA